MLHLVSTGVDLVNSQQSPPKDVEELDLSRSSFSSLLVFGLSDGGAGHHAQEINAPLLFAGNKEVSEFYMFAPSALRRQDDAAKRQLHPGQT
jgi:hypothetical protein